MRSLLAVAALAVLLLALATARAQAQLAWTPYGSQQQQQPQAVPADGSTAYDPAVAPEGGSDPADGGADASDGDDSAPDQSGGALAPLGGLLDAATSLTGDIAGGQRHHDGAAPWSPPAGALPAVTSTFVSGAVARMRIDGRAAIPRAAPKQVRTLIAQINAIVGKRYKWGGGHAKIVDRGYDCSGAVSYGLIRTGLLASPLVSGSLARWGELGAGRFVTIYANKGHAYMEVAGLRLDTSPVGDDPARNGVRWRPVIGKRDGFHVRHPAGL